MRIKWLEDDVLKVFQMKHIFSTVPPAVCLVLNEIPAIEATFKYNRLHSMKYSFKSFEVMKQRNFQLSW
jgi:hypothetical protein